MSTIVDKSVNQPKIDSPAAEEKKRPIVVVAISTLLRNSFWLLLSFGCSQIPLLYAEGAEHLSMAETGVLLGVLLFSTVLLAVADRSPSTGVSVMQHSLAAAIAAVAVLFILSLNQIMFVGGMDTVLPTIVFFIAFRSLGATDFRNIRRPSFLSSRVLLLGNDKPLKKAHELVDLSNGRYHVHGSITYNENADNNYLTHNQRKLLDQATSYGVSKIVVAFEDRRGYMPVHAIMQCRIHGITVLDVPSFYEDVTRSLYIENITPSWFIFSPGFRISRQRRFIKRIFDITLSIFGLILFLFLLTPLGIAIKLDSRGPIFFRQVRIGLGGKPFKVLKLRTMTVNAEQSTGAVWAIKSDPRVTRIGRFLRTVRLDEVPQLINVLMGDMSLVGPRPERPEFTRELEKLIPFYHERHCLKPGVTGWAQVCYPYGSSIDDAQEKLRYDLYYIKNQSLLLDLEIIFKTINVVILGRGAQ